MNYLKFKSIERSLSQYKSIPRSKIVIIMIYKFFVEFMGYPSDIFSKRS